jgi:tRNA(Ile)-lysidine synthase
MRQTVLRYNMLNPGETIIAAVSGGADSVALLKALLLIRDEWRLCIAAVHVNHHMRGENSQTDEDFTAGLCASWSVPLRICHADVPLYVKDKKLSPEEAARCLRYKYLYAVLEEFHAQKIAIAHTQDDNAETVLLNLARGTGLKGLCGIPPVRGVIVRPFIEITRECIETFLAKKGIAFRTDESNFSPLYTRNRIRHNLLPRLREAAGARASEAIARNCAWLRDEEEYLSQTARAAFETCVCKPEKDIPPESADAIWLDIDRLSAMPVVIRRRVVREGLYCLCNGNLSEPENDFASGNGSFVPADTGAVHVESILRLLEGETGRRVELPHGFRAQRLYGQLALYRETGQRHQTETPAPPIDLEPGKPVPIPGTGKYILLSLSAPSVNKVNVYTNNFLYDNMVLTLRTRRPGDRIHIPGAGRRKLQDYFTDRKVPRHLRDAIWLLTCGSDILWVMDDLGRVSASYKPVPGRPSAWVTVG